MDYSYVAPPVPTLGRWRRISAAHPGQSVLRMLEYERLATMNLSGRVLDVGGGRKAGYLPMLPGGITLESVNIDPRIEPTHLIRPGEPMPLADNSFDAAICFNTLEHIYDAMAVLQDMQRVVRPGGQVHVMVPFMFRIHGHPDDYFRATPSWWRESFQRAGFSALALHPLVWGRRSTASVVPGLHGPLARQRKTLAMLLDIVSARLLLRGDTISGRRGESICGTSPGWYLVGTK